jgi:hypothetical protein
VRLDVLEAEVMVIAPIEEPFTARAYAIRVLRLRMVAVKNSIKRRPARSPCAAIAAGSISSPACTRAGGGMIWSAKMIGSLNSDDQLSRIDLLETRPFC